MAATHVVQFPDGGQRAVGTEDRVGDDDGALLVTRPPDLDGLTVHFAKEPKLDEVAGVKATDGAVRAWLGPCHLTTPCTTKVAHDLLR